MQMWSRAICLGWTVIVFLTEMARAGQFKELQTNTTVELHMINELGIQVGGKDHLLFEIKGKGHAHLILSETKNIDPEKGKYYVIALAMTHRELKYRMNGIKYGCVRCSVFHETAIATTVVGNKFTQLWVSWKDGRIQVGDGTDIHKRPFLDYKGPQTYGVNFIDVFTYKYPGQWRFRIDNPPLFIYPLPSGSTMIKVPENSPVNKVVFDIVCEDPENDTVTFNLKNHLDLFHVDNATVFLKHTLDYERQRQYSLMIEAFDGLHRVPVAMSVKVVDVNDEAPVVVVSDDLSIPEELSVGTELGGLFEAKDADHNDKLTFTLQGGDDYFTINETTGKLTLRRRINYDGVYGVRKIDKMTLTVTDKGNNQVKQSLTITVSDINDNSPSFGDIFYRFNVTENGSHRTELANFAITDADSGGNGQFYMDLASTTYLDIFTVEGTSLMVETSKVDYDQLQNQNFAYTLTVRATERSDTEARHVGKATVVVEVLPVNEYYPKWISPKLHGNSVSFEDKTILRHEPAGTIVETFQAEDDDKGKDGEVTYRLISAKSDNGEDVHDHFFMDRYSGQLKTAYYFDIKNESSFYDIMVQAIDGGSSPKSVNGQLKVKLGFGGTGLAGAGGAAKLEGGMTSPVKPAAGIGGADMGVKGGVGAGAVVGIGGGMTGFVRPGEGADRRGGAGMVSGAAGTGDVVGKRGGIKDSVRPGRRGAGVAGIGVAGIGVRGGVGAGAVERVGVGMRGPVRPGLAAGKEADGGNREGQADVDGRADVSRTNGVDRFSGRGRTGDTRGTVLSQGGGDATDSCDNGSSGCVRGKDHEEGSGKSASLCSTALSYRNTEIWVMRGACGLFLFLGAIGLLVVLWKNKNTRMSVAPVSSVSGFGPQGCLRLGEFQSPAPMDTHK